MLGILLSATCATSWVMHRLNNDKPVHLLAAGMSRSASTWQFNALRLLLEHAVSSVNTQIKVHAAHGHALTELKHCLAQRVCVVKMHEFNPYLLASVHAVFVTHRDIRDVLMSSAGKINACLDSGKQPVASAFLSYAEWLPFACLDMQYEDLMETGAPAQIEILAARLGIAHPAHASLPIWSVVMKYFSQNPIRNQRKTAVAIAREIHEETQNPIRNQRKTGFMMGHITGVTTRPGAHTRFNHTFMKKYARCDLQNELRRIESGWGGWLTAHNYNSSSRTNLVVDQHPKKQWLMAHPFPKVAHCPSNHARLLRRFKREHE